MEVIIITLLEEPYNYSMWVLSDLSELFSKGNPRVFFKIYGHYRSLVSLPQRAANVKNCHLGKMLAHLSHGWSSLDCIKPREQRFALL